MLPSIWPGFEIVANPTHNAVILGSLLLVLTTIVNVVGVNVMSRINSIGVTCELVGVVLLCIALFARSERGPGIVLHRGTPAGQQAEKVPGPGVVRRAHRAAHSRCGPPCLR